MIIKKETIVNIHQSLEKVDRRLLDLAKAFDYLGFHRDSPARRAVQRNIEEINTVQIMIKRMLDKPSKD